MDINSGQQLFHRILEDLITEITEYMGREGEEPVTYYYLEALNSISSVEKKDVAPFLAQSINSALELAKLRLPLKYIVCEILHYPVSAKALSLANINDYTDGKLQLIIEKLLATEDYFENYLPWKQEKELSQKTYNELNTSQKSVWKERTIENASQVLIQISQIPEIALMKLIERISLLKVATNIFQVPIAQNIAQQTLDIHAVVAEILGIWSIKWQLEDYAFKLLQPAEYDLIVRDLNERRQAREDAIQFAKDILTEALQEEGLKDFMITGRPKHIYGLYKKSKDLGQSIKMINDNLGIRVLVNSEEDCYRTLGILHELYKPAEGVYGDNLFRDWIVNPKPNNYQSIHTTVQFDEKNHELKNVTRLLEVQIRTYEMHDVAEYGVASHWVYRKAGNSPKMQNRYSKYIEDVAVFRRNFEERQKQRKG